MLKFIMLPIAMVLVFFLAVYVIAALIHPFYPKLAGYVAVTMIAAAIWGTKFSGIIILLYQNVIKPIAIKFRNN